MPLQAHAEASFPLRDQPHTVKYRTEFIRGMGRRAERVGEREREREEEG